MKTYWYIFSYIYLIPITLFIVWSILFSNFDSPWKTKILAQIGSFMIIAWWFLFIIFYIYRWFKATFALYSAVDKNDYTKINFDNSVNVTNNNWWRIVWNFLLLSLLILVISQMIWSVINLIIPWSWNKWNLLKAIWEVITGAESIKINSAEQVKTYLSEYTSNYYTLSNVILDIIKNIIQTIFSVFVIIFTYLFYIRLDEESKTSGNWNTEPKIFSNWSTESNKAL
jgi:hypothetical protein